ncbi:MAG: hypothetical protein GQ574_23090 [Crocinitomix sp.]|nr:hypothetical protein [Crocinitomix sp.]
MRHPGDPTRQVAMSYVLELFEIAWRIKNEKLDLKAARAKYFGQEITGNTESI